jgi:hypothetical protein
MSINLENPDTVLGLVDAAANYVAQITLALRVGNGQHAEQCAEKAQRLLMKAVDKLQDDVPLDAKN